MTMIVSSCMILLHAYSSLFQLMNAVQYFASNVPPLEHVSMSLLVFMIRIKVAPSMRNQNEVNSLLVN